MANDCLYEMKIKGSKKAIKRVVDCLMAGYNYGEEKPAHKHFFRVFECIDDENEPIKNADGTYTKFVWGYCAWSVNCCMTENGYHKEVKKMHPDTFMGTTLQEQSKDCEIEVFSEETGCCFSEHYLYKFGKCYIDDCVETETGGYTKTGKPTKRINWDTYEGDIIVFNPNRLGVDEGFKWII